MDIKIVPSATSKFVPYVDDNIAMGKNFTDHMLVCDYIDGQWQTPEIVPYGNMEMSPALAALHYGQAIFEGIKAYRQPDGSAAIFRPDANWRRMNVSAKRMDMPEISEEIFVGGLKKLLEIEDQWIPNFPETSLYIRPFMFSTDAFIGVKTSDNYRFMIICSPAGKYYSKPVNIYVQDEFIRAAPGGIGFTKAAGNYGASMYPTHQVKEKGYDQILWTDALHNKYVQEIGTMNVFFIVDGKAITPDLASGTILAGVTRDSIITLLKENGIEVEERPIDINELVAAYKAGTFQEAFGSGTAASMSYIQSLTFHDERLQLKDTSEWTLAPKIKAQLDDIRYGRIEDKYSWKTPTK